MQTGLMRRSLVLHRYGLLSPCTGQGLSLLQVRHAEQAGAMAAIIYDDQYEALIIMSKPLGHPDPGIPAVFVTQKTGIIVKRLMTEGVTVVRITLVSPGSSHVVQPLQHQFPPPPALRSPAMLCVLLSAVPGVHWVGGQSRRCHALTEPQAST